MTGRGSVVRRVHELIPFTLCLYSLEIQKISDNGSYLKSLSGLLTRVFGRNSVVD